jgi:NTE family protein
MKQCTAIVLGGGGALGALQAGALRALIETGIHPDLLVGTSIGAVNAACLAVYGFNSDGIARLEKTWQEAAKARLLPWVDLRHRIADWMVYFRGGYGDRIRDFFVAYGIQPDLKFEQISGVRVLFVATDLNSGEPVIYGLNPSQSVLEGMLASAAIPPWVYPLHIRDYYLADGGFVSNLPVEAALDQGADQIITLELTNSSLASNRNFGFRPFLKKVVDTVEKRQSDLELALARARGIPVFRISLKVDEKYSFWDFRCSEELMEIGYEIAQVEISALRNQPLFQVRDQKTDELNIP